MPPATSDVVSVHGNKEVVEFAEMWVEEAKKGRLNWMGVVATCPQCPGGLF